MRFREYKCPAARTCSYPWGDWDDNNKCVSCGISYHEAETVWDKIEDIYHKVVPHRFRPKELWYRLKCRVWKKYTTVKPRTLGHGWCDRDGLLIHCIFEIARDFLENEGPKTEAEWAEQKEMNPAFYESWNETRELIDWWLKHDDHYVYGLTDEEFDAEFPWEPSKDFEGTHEEYRTRAKFLADNEVEKMILEKAKRIIDISQFYWT